MAEPPFLLKRFPIPKASIDLGSFVYNRLEPRQGYFNPSSRLGENNKPKTDESEIQNPLPRRGTSKSIRLEAMLSKLICGWLDKSSSDYNAWSAEKAIEYTLLDSDGWLKEVCANEAVREWLEEALMKDQRTLFLVTAYRTLSNLTFEQVRSSNTKAEIKTQAPTSQIAVAPDQSLDVRVSGGAQQTKHEDLVMSVPDEKIYEVQYRKILLRGFSSQSVDDAYLESGPRWIKLFTFRDGHGLEDEEDAMEVVFDAGNDVPEGYTMVTEYGETSLVPRVDLQNTAEDNVGPSEKQT